MIIYIVALLCFAKPALILVVGLLFVGWSVGWLVCWFVGSWLLFILACCLLLVVGGVVGVGGVVVVAVVAVVVVGGCGRCFALEKRWSRRHPPNKCSLSACA